MEDTEKNHPKPKKEIQAGGVPSEYIYVYTHTCTRSMQNRKEVKMEGTGSTQVLLARGAGRTGQRLHWLSTSPPLLLPRGGPGAAHQQVLFL